MRKKKIDRILVVRLSSMGDIVVLTPIFRSLKEKFPSARVDYLVKKEFVPLVKGNSFIDNVVEFDFRSGLKGWRALCRELSQRGYDVLIDMHNVLRTWLLSLYMFKAIQLRYLKPRLHRFCLFYCYLNLFPEDFSLLKEYYKVLYPLGIEDCKYVPEIELSSEAREKASEVLQKIGLKGDFGVILGVANWANKRYPLEKYKVVAKKVLEKYGFAVLWLGGIRDTYLKDNIQQEGAESFLYLSDSLELSLGILSMARVVVGNDTGLTYAAEALGVPTVLVLGPTSKETGAGLYRSDNAVVEKRLWCRPCSQRGNRKCYRRRQYCFDLIEPEEVIAAVDKVLGKERRR